MSLVRWNDENIFNSLISAYSNSMSYKTQLASSILLKELLKAYWIIASYNIPLLVQLILVHGNVYIYSLLSVTIICSVASNKVNLRLDAKSQIAKSLKSRRLPFSLVGCMHMGQQSCHKIWNFNLLDFRLVPKGSCNLICFSTCLRRGHRFVA